MIPAFLRTFRAIAVVLLALILLGVGRKKAALQCLDWHLRNGSRHVRSDAFVSLLSGIILKNLGDTDTALERMENAIAITPRWFYPRMWAADVAYRAHRHEKAAEHLQELISLGEESGRKPVNPKFLADYYAMLAHSVSRLGQVERSRKLYLTALLLDPSNDEIRKRCDRTSD